MKSGVFLTLLLCVWGFYSNAQSQCGGQIRNAGPCTVSGFVNYTNDNGEPVKYSFTLCNNGTGCRSFSLSDVTSATGGCSGVKDITVYYDPAKPVTINWGSPSTTTVITGGCSPGRHMVQYMSISNDLAIY